MIDITLVIEDDVQDKLRNQSSSVTPEASALGVRSSSDFISNDGLIYDVGQDELRTLRSQHIKDLEVRKDSSGSESSI